MLFFEDYILTISEYIKILYLNNGLGRKVLNFGINLFTKVSNPYIAL